MNKIIFMICALYMMVCMSGMSSTQVNYTIKGTVNGINGKTAYLYAAEGDRFIIDSTTVNDNSFTFKGTQPKQCFALISIGKNNRGVILILENGIINATIDKQGTRAIGTPTNDILNACNEKINAFNDEFYALRKQASELKENQKDEMAVLQKNGKNLLKNK